jgi:outer membrane protein OmpA-like peptidoglycan-associated protein
MSMTLARPLSIGLLVASLFLPAAALAQARPTSPPPPPPDEEPLPPSFPHTRTPAPGAGPDSTVSAAPAERTAQASTAAVSDSYLPSLTGSLGLYHISTAEVGPANHLRLALHGEYFRSTGFLIGCSATPCPAGESPDTNSRMNGSFSFGYTVHPNIEIFGAILTSSNRNKRTNMFEDPPRRDPELIKSFGDLVLGPKAVMQLARGMTGGLELGLRFLSSISDLSVSPSSTSLWFGPRYSVDLRQINELPLRIHAAADFYLDNSRNLIDLDDPSISPWTAEVAMFAYGIARNRMRFALAIDAPLEKLTAPVPLNPFIEYHAQVVTADKDPVFMNFPKPDNRDQQFLTVGLRARVYKGITLDAGVDVRLRSVGYQYGPPLPPYNVIFGGAFPLDIDAFTKPVVVTRTIERNVGAGGPAPALEGQLTGNVKSSRDGKPVGGALVAVARRPLSRVATDPDGNFQSVMLPPGPAELEISAPGFETAKVNAAVQLGRSQKLQVTLTAKTLTGNVRGKVTDAKGNPLPAALRLAGVEVFSAQADQAGQFSASLPVGPYRVTAEMPQMPSKEVSLDIVEGVDRQLDIVMRAPNANVTLAGDTITLKQPIKFKAGPPRLDAKMQAQLDGVAELLQDHPEIRTLRVEAWWDSSAGKNAQTLTEGQAKAVKDHLVKKGIPEGRIEAVGHGADNPLVPNIGPVNKAKNRRVELHVVQ